MHVKYRPPCTLSLPNIVHEDETGVATSYRVDSTVISARPTLGPRRCIVPRSSPSPGKPCVPWNLYGAACASAIAKKCQHSGQRGEKRNVAVARGRDSARGPSGQGRRALAAEGVDVGGVPMPHSRLQRHVRRRRTRGDATPQLRGGGSAGALTM